MVDLSRRSWFNRICGTVLVLAALIVACGFTTTTYADEIADNVTCTDVPIAPDVGAGGVTAIIEFMACDDGAGGVVLVGVFHSERMDTDEGAYCERGGQGPIETRSWAAGISPTYHIGKTSATPANQFTFRYSFREPKAVRAATITPVNAAAAKHRATRSRTFVLRC